MCYFLYGAVNKGINQKDYDDISCGNSYHFNIGTRHDVKMAAIENTDDFRLTDGCCDCESAIGCKDPSHEEIKELCRLLNDMRMIDNIEYVYMSKTWVGKTNKKEECYHIDDIDLAEFLANMKENYLYRIDMGAR